MPTTSSSSPEPYLEAFENASRKASSILCLTEPRKFSAMFESAQVAVELAKKSIHNTVIEVMESTTAAAGQGLVTMAAAREAALDKPLEEVKKTAFNIMSRTNIFAMLDTLHYLTRSGRVPQAAALVNSILNIKPVFTLNHSDAHTVAIPRTIKSAINRILKLMDSHIDKELPLYVAVMHADALQNANDLKKRIISQFNCTEIFITEFTPVMGVHTGPGLFGVAYYNDEPPA
jgi:DegV family protein with EDD domain